MSGYQQTRTKGQRAYSRRALLGGIGAGAVLAACAGAPHLAMAGGRGARPNIIFIMADDLGYADLSCFGRRDYETPAIDSLARDGLKFLSAYSNSPVCSATRTALMSGQYQYRLPVGLEEPLTSRNVGYPPGHVSLPSILKAAGYQTSLVGKWHLGRLPNFGPLKSGYDHFWGFRNGGIGYFTHRMGRPDLWDGDVPVSETGYLTDLLGQKAVEQIEAFSQVDAPFFMSLHFSAPHWPWEGPGDTEESQRLAGMADPTSLFHYDGGTLKTYAEIVTRLDNQVGKVLETLQRLGIADNTIVIFTSDNGGERFSDTWPFSGRKTEVLEGGIRVPTLMRWPAKVRAGLETDVPVMTMDWLPTLVAAAGATTPAGHVPDGSDLAGLFAGGTLQERTLYWRYNIHDQKAVRKGRYKYLSISGHEFLFDVVDDPLERGNLKARRPEIFAELKTSFEQWNAGMLPYDSLAFSHSLNGEDSADRYSTDPEDSTTGGAPMAPPPPR